MLSFLHVYLHILLGCLLTKFAVFFGVIAAPADLITVLVGVIIFSWSVPLGFITIRIALVVILVVLIAVVVGLIAFLVFLLLCSALLLNL